MSAKKKNDTAKKALRGEEGFNAFYEELFGPRWQALKESLLEEVSHIKLSYNGMKPYFLDPASVCASLCLPLNDAEEVLDLCAAPGGKTLVLAGNLEKDSRLSSNERSPDRKARLAKVVQESLPEEKAAQILTSCSDGALWCKRQTEAFDSILLDAPCSSERHVLTDPKYLKDWSPARIKTVSTEQWALISSAFRLLKKNGYLLYATCALAPQENDEQMKRLSKKFPDAVFVSDTEIKENFKKNLFTFEGNFSAEKTDEDKKDFLSDLFTKAEKTEYGYHLLPDTSSSGPLYFCLVKKVSEEN